MIKTNFIALASLIICACSIWAICSKHYKDGLIGKIILFFMAISAFATFTKSHYALANDISETTLLCTLALYWMRHIWIALAWHPLVKRYYKNNPHRDRRKNEERRKESRREAT